MKKLLILTLLLVFVVLACNREVTPRTSFSTDTDPKPKNIILMVGDGMGVAQISASMYDHGNKTVFEEFKSIGLHKNQSSSDLVTDSAAGATAFACGKKTYNGAIGVDADTIPCETILEVAQKKGYATGLIATSTITHATPASFAAHVKQRKMYEDIALDLSHSGVDFMVGGGRKFFDRRVDERNLLEEMSKNGYAVSNYFDKEYKELELDPTKKLMHLTADKDPLHYAQGREYLIQASEDAMPFLAQRSDQGFFLMIEGSQIDWGGHANQSDYIITEMREFDATVRKVLDWVKKDGETLLVITADHETGGYSIVKPSRMDSLVTAFTTDYHTATLIPVFAYGPGSEQFSGIYENTAIYDKMMEVIGW